MRQVGVPTGIPRLVGGRGVGLVVERQEELDALGGEIDEGFHFWLKSSVAGSGGDDGWREGWAGSC